MKLGKKEIFNSTLIPNEVVDVLVVRKSYSQHHPDIIQQLVSSWFKALEYQEANPVKSAEYSLKRFDTTSADYIAGLKLLEFSSKENNLHFLNAASSPLLEQQHKIIKILEEIDLISKTPSLEGHLDKSYIH